ncbi:MAG: hypothetical protein OCU24_03545 [Candidatus Methanospirare jalkutatii]|nr:hypothetical protein [Candidatus Methanospirare jalkutatii]
MAKVEKIVRKHAAFSSKKALKKYTIRGSESMAAERFPCQCFFNFNERI